MSDIVDPFADDRFVPKHAEPVVTSNHDERLPPDVAAVWVHPNDQRLARMLIKEWGLEAFRASALHQQALQGMGSLRADPKKARK